MKLPQTYTHNYKYCKFQEDISHITQCVKEESRNNSEYFEIKYIKKGVMKDGVKGVSQNKNESMQRDRTYGSRDDIYLESSQEVQYLVRVSQKDNKKEERIKEKWTDLKVDMCLQIEKIYQMPRSMDEIKTYINTILFLFFFLQWIQ